MKTKVFLTLCVTIVFAMSQLSAQNVLNSKGTGTLTSVVQWDGAWPEIVCGSGIPDHVSGTVILNKVVHYTKFKVDWANYHLSGVAGSIDIIPPALAPDVFVVQSGNVKVYLPKGLISLNFNLVGSLGKTYMGTMTYDFDQDLLLSNSPLSCFVNIKKKK